MIAKCFGVLEHNVDYNNVQITSHYPNIQLALVVSGFVFFVKRISICSKVDVDSVLVKSSM